MGTNAPDSLQLATQPVGEISEMTRVWTLLFLTAVAAGLLSISDAKQHDAIKEYHFHVYWFQTNMEQTRQAVRLRSMIIDNVKAGNFTAVCNGVVKATNPRLTQLDEENVPDFNVGPRGPHPCGSFEVWTPKEFLPQLMSFFMLNRGDLSILLHPLGGALGISSHEGHTTHAMWLGPSFRIDLSILPKTAGDPPQYPGLKLGYS